MQALLMAMVAGVFPTFGSGMVVAVTDAWAVTVPMVAVFVACSLLPRLGAWMPPIVGAAPA